MKQLPSHSKEECNGPQCHQHGGHQNINHKSFKKLSLYSQKHKPQVLTWIFCDAFLNYQNQSILQKRVVQFLPGQRSFSIQSWFYRFLLLSEKNNRTWQSLCIEWRDGPSVRLEVELAS